MQSTKRNGEANAEAVEGFVTEQASLLLGMGNPLLLRTLALLAMAQARRIDAMKGGHSYHEQIQDRILHAYQVQAHYLRWGS